MHKKSDISQHGSERGFSLLELIVYIGILAIIMVVLYAALTTFMQARARTVAGEEVSASLRYLAERLTRDVQNANALTDIASSSVTLDGEEQISYTWDGIYIFRTIGSSTPERVTSERVNIDAFTLTAAQVLQPLLSATTTTIGWVIDASYAHPAPEYGFEATQRGSAMMREE